MHGETASFRGWSCSARHLPVREASKAASRPLPHWHLMDHLRDQVHRQILSGFPRRLATLRWEVRQRADAISLRVQGDPIEQRKTRGLEVLGPAFVGGTSVDGPNVGTRIQGSVPTSGHEAPRDAGPGS